MKNNKLKKLLLVLSVMGTTYAVDQEMDNNIAEANVKAEWRKTSYGQWYVQYSNGTIATNKWVGNYYLGSNGIMLTNSWTPDGYYVDGTGKWVPGMRLGWSKVNNIWYYRHSNGTLAVNKWVGNYYLGSNGAMLVNSWTPDGYYVDATGKWVPGMKKEQAKATIKTGWIKENNLWYYRYSNGTLAVNKWVGNYYLGSKGVMLTSTWTPDGYYVDGTGKWVPDMKKTSKSDSKYYTIKETYSPIYDAYGNILTYVSKNSVVFKDNKQNSNGRIAVSIAGVSGYINEKHVEAATSSTFIPDYISDGVYVYHRFSATAKRKVAYHNPNMKIGVSYYSTDGINFDGFTLTHPFQFKNLKTKTNYSAEEINKIYKLMGVTDGKLANKGETFKAAEARYGVNALYLVAHSAIESNWGRSRLAMEKSNFFGIAAYDQNPFNSATKFDDVDAGILGAAKWINSTYLVNTGYPARGAFVGNKSAGMNVNYATDPYWGEKIASTMFEINELLGRKDIY